MAAALLVSCSKERATLSATQRVRVGYEVVSERPMTKGTTDPVAEWIGANLPASLQMTLTDKDGKTYNVTTGEEVELPIGTYSVVASAYPYPRTEIIGSTVTISNAHPALTINATLEVSYTQKSYTVPATFEAFGVAVKLDEIDGARYHTSRATSGTLTFAQVGDYGVTFINGDLESFSVDIILLSGGVGAETTYTFKKAHDSETISPTWGNYYLLHPRKVITVDGGQIGYETDTFGAVDIEAK